LLQQYDAILKSALRHLTGSVLKPLSGVRVSRWLNVDLPTVQSRRADMLGEAADGTLLHIELQSANQARMAHRMLEYASAIERRFGRFPEQMVLYVGSAGLRMKGELSGPGLRYRCRMVDIRELDGEALLTSRRVEDNIIAILARLGDERRAIQRILGRIAKTGSRRREAILTELVLLAGLRKLEPILRQEAEKMPILNDIMDHQLIGPAIRKGLRQGLEKGLEQGRQEGERTLILRLIARRFGPVSPAVRKRIEALPARKLERLGLRLLDADSLEELLR
jgi:predicted transposase YdaD